MDNHNQLSTTPQTSFQKMMSSAEFSSHKTDLEQLMEPLKSWEEFLVNAPMSVAMLGRLMLLSSSQDFSLHEYAPVHGFQYVKWPKSFRASISQLSDQGWKALNTAHDHMNFIRQSTAQIPGHFSTILLVIVQGSTNEVEHLLPQPIKRIEHMAFTCLEKSEATVAVIQNVIDLVLELQAAILNIRKSYEELDDRKVMEEKQLSQQCNLAEFEELKRQLQKMKEENNVVEQQKELKRMDVTSVNNVVVKTQDKPAANVYESIWKKCLQGMRGRSATIQSQSSIDTIGTAQQLIYAEQKSFVSASLSTATVLPTNMHPTTLNYGTTAKTSSKPVTFIKQSNNLTRTQLDEYLNVFKTELNALVELQNQWKELIRFFGMISNIVERSFQSVTAQLVDTAKSSTKLESQDTNRPKLVRKLLCHLTFKAMYTADVIHMLSGSYVEVSTGYLMPQLQYLGRLLEFDKSQNIETQQEQLAAACRRAQDGIRLKLKERKERLDRQMIQREKEMDFHFHKLIPNDAAGNAN